MNSRSCVILDTNELVSGLLSELGAPGHIMDLALAGHLSLGYDERILAEYTDVLHRPELDLDAGRGDDVLRLCEMYGQRVVTEPWPLRLPDPDDEKFLAAAAALAAPLITGNLRHYPSAVRRNVEVLSPRAFLDAWPRA